MEGQVRPAAPIAAKATPRRARSKTLEEENARLKRLLADAMLDNVALKDLLGKKW